MVVGKNRENSLESAKTESDLSLEYESTQIIEEMKMMEQVVGSLKNQRKYLHKNIKINKLGSQRKMKLSKQKPKVNHHFLLPVNKQGSMNSSNSSVNLDDSPALPTLPLQSSLRTALSND